MQNNNAEKKTASEAQTMRTTADATSPEVAYRGGLY